MRPRIVISRAQSPERGDRSKQVISMKDIFYREEVDRVKLRVPSRVAEEEHDYDEDDKQEQ